MPIIKEQVIIRDLRPHDVWPFIADPEMMRQWNSQLISVSRSRRGLVSRGERYGIRFRMMEREQDMTVTIDECQRDSRLALVHRQPDELPARFVREIYELSSQGYDTLIRQSIDLRQAGIPLWARLFIRLIDRFGQHTGPTSLQRLKVLLEEDQLAAR